MKPHDLRLIRRDGPPRETAAWFLAGGEPARWLEELSRWAVPLEEMRCHVVPRGWAENGAGGLLVMPPAGGAKPADARALALGAIGGNLFLPVDAELFPPVADAETAALGRAAVTLFHPGLGLVEFAAADARGVWDLLARPELAEADWNAAQAGAVLSSRLAGVALQALPGMGDIFGDAQKDIGSQPIVKLPPRPREPSAGAGGKIGRALTEWGAGAVAKMLSKLPANSARRTWVNDVLDWAEAKLGSVSREMEELRNRELLRLMHLLESDPDRGLRHALPLGGDPARGRTAPGAHLGPRDVNFNLRNLGGGKPADPWNMPWEMRQKLIARYRELALHEQQLGRFRRAAYIHAQLLGDLSAAAAVLREGRLFAEAAVLYRDHLRQPGAAAECFAEAALFAEAIAIYEKAENWLELGDLHRRLGDEAAAAAAYRRVVEAKVAALDFIGAAELLDGKLHAPDEALALLGRGWPDAPQGARCLAAEFALLGRLGRHEAALLRLGGLRAEETPRSKTIALGEVLDTLRTTYPDHAVRARAVDLARVKVSDRLACGELPEVRAGVQIIARLAPEDRLLARDASRFLAARTELLRTRVLPAPPPRKAGSGRIGPPLLSRRVRLPAGLQWLAVKRAGPNFFAVVRKRGQLIFLRGNWDGSMQQVVEEGRSRMNKSEVESLAADEGSSQPDFMLTLPGPHDSPAMHTMPWTDLFPLALRVGMPDWMPEQMLALSVSGAQWWVLRIAGPELILDERTEDGRLVGGFEVGELVADIGDAGGTFSMLALRRHVWLACGPNLLLFKGGIIECSWRLESPILGLEASAPFLPCAVVARCERGAAVFWHDAFSASVEMIAPELKRPRAVFLGNGTLILLAGESDGRGCDGRAVDLDRKGIHSEATFYKLGGTPLALVGTDRPDEFAVFDGTSEAQIWRVPVGR